MSYDRRAWLERLVEACKQAAARVDGDDPPYAALANDIRELRARAEQELADARAAPPDVDSDAEEPQ